MKKPKKTKSKTRGGRKSSTRGGRKSSTKR